MGKINVLDKSVYNLISAGEVIERPSSIVKELVENSIDAGANEITISILDGGKTQILITDNGCGISEEDLNLCYLPHSTSKISKAEDLDMISTLGFRGEALASITAIAQVKITTKTQDEELGHFIQVNGSQVIDQGQAGACKGTSILVENIFFNTPVRRKFLKKEKQEESYISKIVSELIFANPEIKFTYISDNKTIYKTNGGLDNALYAVYNTDLANQMLAFDNQVGDIRVYGYTGNRLCSKHNKTYQTIIINGRTVVNTTIQTAVTQAYGEHLMKRCYPVFILNILMPFDEVDVNVHPNKNEVRFQDNRKIFSAVYHTINQTLASESQKLCIGDSTETNTPQQTDLFTNDNDDNIVYRKQFGESNLSSSSNNNITIDNINNFVNSEESIRLNEALLEQKRIISNNSNFIFNDTNDNKVKPIKDFNEPIQSDLFKQAEDSLVQNYEIIGQLFDTFLIIQSGEKAYLIDQHAMHERFLYDKLMDRFESQTAKSQEMLVPYIIETSADQYDYFISIIPALTELGFEISEFGGLSFKVSAVPMILTNMNLESFFNNVLNEKKQNYNITKGELIKDKLATMACKAAIKGGDKFSNIQIKSILDKMENGIPLQCPHGRPAVIEITRTMLDKLFKRIV